MKNETEIYTVIAWNEPRHVWNGEPFALDERPKMKLISTARALVWCRGDETPRAIAHASKMDYPTAVWVIESTNPLEVARLRIATEHQLELKMA